MTSRQFRRIALGMHGATEGEHMAHPDFRADGRIFATIAPGARQGMIRLSPDQQQVFIAAYPEMFVPAKGAWGRSGCTMVQFASADAETVGEAMTLAWQSVMSTAKRKPKAKSTATKPRRR